MSTKGVPALPDEEALKAFRYLISHLRERTLSAPHSFSNTLNDFVSDLNDITSHIRNDNLRKSLFYFMTLRMTTSAAFDYALQNYVRKRLEEILKGEAVSESLKARTLYGINNLRVRVLSDGRGRNIIDIDDLYSDFREFLRELDAASADYIMSKIIQALKDVYNKFVEDYHKELIKVYDELLEASNRNWQAVFTVLDKYILIFDSMAMFWLRGGR